jgi:hypothetical protein
LIYHPVSLQYRRAARRRIGRKAYSSHPPAAQGLFREIMRLDVLIPVLLLGSGGNSRTLGLVMVGAAVGELGGIRPCRVGADGGVLSAIDCTKPQSQRLAPACSCAQDVLDRVDTGAHGLIVYPGTRGRLGTDGENAAEVPRRAFATGPWPNGSGMGNVAG